VEERSALPIQKGFGKRQWYLNIFNDMGADWEAIVNARDTRKEASFIEGNVSKKHFILDLCCGTGRHSIILSQRGFNVIGLDLSKNLLAIAKMRMMEAGVNLPLVRADMRYFPFQEDVFGAVISMFTSFGYLPSEAEDLKCLSEVSRTLKKNGRFLLDVASLDHIIKVFRERDWAEFEPFYLLERRSLDVKNSRLTSQWTLIYKRTAHTRSIEHSVRLYTFAQIEQSFGMTGLIVNEVYGGYDKKEFNKDASRMIVIAQKY
jgi:SAM-dependent methyltransferase